MNPDAEVDPGSAGRQRGIFNFINPDTEATGNNCMMQARRLFHQVKGMRCTTISIYALCSCTLCALRFIAHMQLISVSSNTGEPAAFQFPFQRRLRPVSQTFYLCFAPVHGLTRLHVAHILKIEQR